MTDIAALLAADHASSPIDALSAHRELWPLNSQLAETFDDPRSDRVRLRRVVEAVRAHGISIGGLEPSNAMTEPIVQLQGQLGRTGALWSGSLIVHVSDREGCESERVLAAVQTALQAHGYPACVTMNGRVVVADSGGMTEEEIRWLETGFLASTAPIVKLTADEAARWRIAGGGAMNDLKLIHYVSGGFSVEDAAPWLEAGFAGDVAEGWRDAGATIEEACAWADVGIRTAEVASDLIGDGIAIADLAAWRESGKDRWDLVLRARVPQRWKAAGLTAQDAAAAMAANEHRALAAVQSCGLVEDGSMRPQELSEWLATGLELSAIVAWWRSGATAQEAAAWQQLPNSAMLANPDRARQLIDSGLTVEEIGRWLALDRRFAKVELIESWTSRGMGPQDAEGWVQAHHDLNLLSHEDSLLNGDNVQAWMDAHPACKNPEVVRELAKLRLTPDTVPLVADLLNAR